VIRADVGHYLAGVIQRYGIADVSSDGRGALLRRPISNAGSAYANACSKSAREGELQPAIDTRDTPAEFLFHAEYPMVRWHEANGYNVKYISGVDTERRAGDLVGSTKPKLFGRDTTRRADEGPLAWLTRPGRRRVVRYRTPLMYLTCSRSPRATAHPDIRR